MECLFCRRGVKQGVSLFRVNAKGRPGIWACSRHVGQTDASISPDVKAVVSALSTPSDKEGGE